MALLSFAQWKANRDEARRIIAELSPYYRSDLSIRPLVDAARNTLYGSVPFPDPRGIMPLQYMTMVNQELGLPAPQPGGESYMNRQTMQQYSNAFGFAGIDSTKFLNWINATFAGNSSPVGALVKSGMLAVASAGFGGAIAGALGGSIGANIAAASLVGGSISSAQGGDFVDGAVKGALSAAIGAGLSEAGIAAEFADALKAAEISPEIANKIAKTAENAVKSAIVAEATGGDAGDAIVQSLLSAGISIARSELGDIVNSLTAGETAADIEDAELGAAMTEAAAAPQEALIAAPQQIQPEQIEAETPVETPEVTQEELMAEIQPEIAAPETVVSEVIEAPDVPRETMEELLPEEEPAVELPLEEELPEEQPIPEAMPEVEPEPVLPEEGQVEEMAEEEEAAPEEAMAEEEAPAEEEAAISDEDVLEAMAEEEPGAEEEAMAEEEEAAPAEEAAPEGAEEPVAEEAGGERVAETTGPSDIDRLIAKLLLSDRGGQVSRIGAARETAISPRELSGSVTGIIGKKQPMFGGDEDEQTAEWNRRSLRLRKVLGL